MSDLASNIGIGKNNNWRKKLIIILSIIGFIIIGIALIVSLIKNNEIRDYENQYISETQTIASDYNLEDVSISLNYIRKTHGLRTYELILESPSYDTLEFSKQFALARKVDNIDVEDAMFVVLPSITSNGNKYTLYSNFLHKNNSNYLVNGSKPPEPQKASNTSNNTNSTSTSNSPSYTYTPTEDEKTNAIVIAKQEVKNQLKSPSTAKFPWSFEEYSVKKSSDNHFIVSAYVDAENSFGAKIRTYYTVKFKKTGEESYVLEGVNIIE